MNCTSCGELLNDSDELVPGLVELGLCRACYAADDPCTHCGGKGWRDIPTDNGPREHEPCEACEGSGHRDGWPLSAEEHRDRHEQDLTDLMKGG